MPLIEPFEKHTERYISWFDRYRFAYQSELEAVRQLWPESAYGLEVGVGAGHFAAPLKIPFGVEPSQKMRRLALSRGITVCGGQGELLPFSSNAFDAVLMVTTVCFLDDPLKTLREIRRVLCWQGAVVIGFIDKESELGREYTQKKSENPFYRSARFFSTCQIIELLLSARFCNLSFRQTLFTHPCQLKSPDRVCEGYGSGSFVVVRAFKTNS